MQVVHKRGNPPWFWNPGQVSPEVQNRGISDPTKRTNVLQNITKQGIHIISFEPISKRLTSNSFHEFIVNRCDWCILAGNSKKIVRDCLHRKKEKTSRRRYPTFKKLEITLSDVRKWVWFVFPDELSVLNARAEEILFTILLVLTHHYMVQVTYKYVKV